MHSDRVTVERHIISYREATTWKIAKEILGRLTSDEHDNQLDDSIFRKKNWQRTTDVRHTGEINFIDRQ